MKTGRTISNVTWNSLGHFKKTADALVAEGVLDWYHAIEHKAEADEDKKDHIHFVVKPSKAVDTIWLSMRFAEWVEGEEKPRKPTNDWHFVQNGHLGDWLLYALHDKDFLTAKLEKREYEYTLEDIVTSDQMALECAYREAKRSEGGHIAKLRKAYEMGLTLDAVLLSGAIPLPLHRAAVALWEVLASRDSVSRGGRKGHEDGEGKDGKR